MATQNQMIIYKPYQLEGIILGFEACGAKFVKVDGKSIYFRIPATMDEGMLLRAAEGAYGLLGLRMRVHKDPTLLECK